MRHQFQALAPARVRQRGQSDGQEIDLDAYLRFATDRHAGAGTHGDGLYRDTRKGARDLVCLLLSDLSLSTDTWVDDRARVIDVIRDSLFLFAESLAATGDRFGLLGFSSRRRDPVRIHSLKDFDEPHGAGVRGRIAAVKPGSYTRRAVQEARALGLTCFCVTIDERGNDYLPHLFGAGGYVVIRRPTALPAQLPVRYARLTA